ncbi:hypothetical protein ABT294_00885 [Nonomuraea sp. NPDC000554]|uniref:hypothetical protein n=1 Tax=Nonomuraea sp. NPDC000554 TaxID=3154259 RepID=UPI00332E6DD0
MAACQVDRDRIDAWVARTRTEQGLPPVVEDPVALATIAALVLPYFKEKGLLGKPAPVRRSA